MPNRVIKFRGKDLEGIWKYGYLLGSRSVSRGSLLRGNIDFDESLFAGRQLLEVDFFGEVGSDRDCVLDTSDTCFVLSDSVCQYTGVKDKNGVDIYEGDIVRFMYNTFKIVFGSMSCRFDLININPNHFNDYLYGYNSDDYEVVGNIYDNPELLKNV